MTLSKTERYLVYDTSLQLLQQDLLTNAYLQGSSVGRSLRDMVLQRQPVQPLTNPFDEAITGTLRADARAVAQNARNVSEAAAMMGVGEEGVRGVQSALDEMEDIIEQINSGELDGSDATVQQTYDDLKSKIDGYIANTDYNGIYMLDSTQWGTEQIDSNGSVFIQAFKDGGFNVNFQAVDALSTGGGETFDDLSGADLATDPSRADQLGIVQQLKSQVTSIGDSYESRKESLEFQAARLESQSGLLDQAVEARRQEPTLSTEDILLNLIMRDTGSLLDESG